MSPSDGPALASIQKFLRERFVPGDDGGARSLPKLRGQVAPAAQVAYGPTRECDLKLVSIDAGVSSIDASGSGVGGIGGGDEGGGIRGGIRGGASRSNAWNVRTFIDRKELSPFFPRYEGDYRCDKDTNIALVAGYLILMTMSLRKSRRISEKAD